ncbi:restriction endonuclease subunit S [Lactiplantibacillus pentosus]|jgi:type I restriction enzyme S subunit|uniref:restriction endonuclease subunit S n=1 Tax=Lactiplantibacillus pentosus TaxID=1589 RepID=UPI0021A5B325|nr:restriction endonuclease subunit S [Lactiplantibacillus pentosus]MCT3289178.1 restriction endonuclease subunit S [Lactiplantibacillus pentosus]
MKNENLVPKVRFKGFSDPWEQRKLSEIGKIHGGGTPDSGKPEYWNGTINWFTPTEVSNNGFLENSIRKITNLGLKKSSATLLPPKTVLITSRAGVGNMGILKYPASTNQGFQSFIPDSNTDEYFIYSMQPFISRIANRWASGSTFTEISGKQMAKIEIGIPDTSEQKKISELMKTIDNLIAANEDKLEQLKTLKKLLMQKIFSQEWRFKGFTDPWEQRKLSDISETTVGGGTPDTKIVDYWSGSIPWIQSSNLEKDTLKVGKIDKYVSSEGIVNSATKLIAKNSIAVVTRVGVGKLAVIPFEYTTSQDFLSFSNLNVSRWFGAYLLYRILKREAEKSQGTSIKGITKKALLQLDVQIPADTQEQSKIGTSLNKTDDLIAANEDKLQQLKELKKYLMQNMFV